MTRSNPARGGLRRPLCALLLLAASATAAHAVAPPWRRTETREACSNFDPYRQPYFGDTHVHTSYSSDAVFAGTREDPRAAYRFATGEEIGLPPYDAQDLPTRTAQLRRPLDFTAVTDHAEQFGEISICLTPGLPDYDSAECVAARAQIDTPPPALPSLLPPPAVVSFLLGYGALNPPQRFSWCGPGGEDCLAQASLIWQDTRAAAEEFYDRTSACTFTSFVGYEWSGQPFGNNLHRNVIFRNEVAPALPISFMEEPTPQGLWDELQAQCLDGLPGCDVLAIPHNPNVSGGLMFAPVGANNAPLTAASAAFRAGMEPLVEMNQHKGDSECRTGTGGATDEECGFEKNNRLQLFNAVSDPNQNFPALNYVRNALKEGLKQELQLGVNPFRFGLIGSTDTHNSTPGATEEEDFGAFGHIGLRDNANPAFMVQRVTPAGIEGSGGGLAVLWAEENSRDALFAAMRRREAYGTSGSRPILRFFAGLEPGLECGAADFVEKAYEGGVPMGGELGPVRGGRSPRFALLAFRDPGVPGSPGTPLQRAQIVKGWVDELGETHEQVFDVAGNAANGASVDTANCATSGPGEDSLCAVWTDPDFDASQKAFYYARILENPTCRWSTIHCNNQGIDCNGTVPSEYAECCNPSVPKTIQERAWSSPIWYRRDGLAKVSARIAFSAKPQRDKLKLKLIFGGTPPGFDPSSEDISIALRDDDEVYAVTIPAGTMQQPTAGRFLWKDPAGTIGGIRSVVIRQSFNRMTISLVTVPMAFPAADREDHFVELSLRAGPVEIDTPVLFRMRGSALVAKR